MAPFYGSVQGNRGEATRLGSNESGMEVLAASWQGGVRTHLFKKENGEVWATVRFTPWHGQGVSETLYHGPVGGTEDLNVKEQLIRESERDQQDEISRNRVRLS